MESAQNAAAVVAMEAGSVEPPKSFNPCTGGDRAENKFFYTGVAACRAPDVSFVASAELKTTRRGALESDPTALQTNIPSRFVSGDVAAGPSPAVEAIGAKAIAAFAAVRPATIRMPPALARLPDAKLGRAQPEQRLENRAAEVAARNR